jgi:hypothetical protein
MRICARVCTSGCVRCAGVDGHIAHRRMCARVRAGVRTRARGRTARSARSVRRATPATSRRWGCCLSPCEAQPGPVRARRRVRICARLCTSGFVRCAGVDGHIAHRRMCARVRASGRANARTRAHSPVSAVSAESDAGTVPPMELLPKALRSPTGPVRARATVRADLCARVYIWLRALCRCGWTHHSQAHVRACASGRASECACAQAIQRGQCGERRRQRPADGSGVQGPAKPNRARARMRTTCRYVYAMRMRARDCVCDCVCDCV